MPKFKTSKPGARDLGIRLRTRKRRKASSTRWLERHLNDPYVRQARDLGYRSRAAFKLIELNERFKFLRFGCGVLDLGCAPGSWTQVAVEQVNALGTVSGAPVGRVFGIDIQECESVGGALIREFDIQSDFEIQPLLDEMGGKVDAVLSDMAAPSVGHKKTDHLRTIALCEVAADFSFRVLNPDGAFVAKVLAGGAESKLQNELKKRFKKVLNVKPAASRSDSSEKYVVAIGYKNLDF